MVNIGLPTVVIVLLGLIKIPKIEINIWKWLARSIGRLFSSEVLSEIRSIKEDVSKLRDELNSYEDKFDKYAENDVRSAASSRRRIILEFSDDVKNGRRFSEEHWNSILEIIDWYTKYCNEHKDFPNSKADMAIKYILDEYGSCLRDNKFL